MGHKSFTFQEKILFSHFGVLCVQSLAGTIRVNVIVFNCRHTMVTVARLSTKQGSRQGLVFLFDFF